VAFEVECIVAHLEADTDRSGTIGPEDDPDEYPWTWGPEGSGAIFLPNVDDDDWAAGHTAPVHMDGATPGIDGATDRSDLARVIVQQVEIPSDWHARLVMAGTEDHITVYDLASGSAVLGLHAGGEILYEIPTDRMVSGGLILGMERDDLVRAGSPSTGTLKLEFLNEQVDVVCSDIVEFRLSPWVMTSNLDQAQTVYVRQLPPTDALYPASVQFVNDLQAALAGTGATLVVVDDPYYGGDVWIQDQIEFGFASASYGSLSPIVFNSPRDRVQFGPNHGLRDFAERALFRPDMGYFTRGSDAGTQDASGNLDVSPPVTVNGKEYPFGRIYTGIRMQSAIYTELYAQVMQDPFMLHTDWLKVEHVDEVVTFVPDLATGGGAFKALIADPTLGFNLLLAEPDPDTTIGKPESPGSITVSEALSRYGSANDTWGHYERYMNTIRATLMVELGLLDSDFVRVPAFFAYPSPPDVPEEQYSEAYSLLPNLVNLLVVDGRLIAPEPFYDGVKQEFVSRLSAIAYQHGTSLRFVDDWEVYHDKKGDIHCGTSVQRAPASVDWWRYQGG
jgi:protein-arginine deiminase